MKSEKEIIKDYDKAKEAYYDTKQGTPERTKAAAELVKARDAYDLYNDNKQAMLAIELGISDSDIDKIDKILHAPILDDEIEKLSKSIDMKFNFLKQMCPSEFDKIKNSIHSLKNVPLFM